MLMRNLAPLIFQVDTTDVTSTEATSDATPDEVVPRHIIKEAVSPLKSTVVTVR